MTQMLTISETAALLRSADRYLLLTHRNPDGDTIGSAAALCRALQTLGRTCYVYPNFSRTKRYLPFLEDLLPPQDYKPEFIISVDIADPQLLTSDTAHFADAIDLCIDHHTSNKLYAKHTCLDGDQAACGILIFQLIAELGLALTKEIAFPLYLAITTDTGCFRYANTNAFALRVAADLLETGIDANAINEQFFELKSKTRFAVESRLFNEIRYFDEGRIAISVVMDQMIHELGAQDEDVENISSLLRTIDGVSIGISIRERAKDSWRVSVRTSTGINASRICAAFNGGGHIRAAGCTINSTLDEAISALLLQIESEKEDI